MPPSCCATSAPGQNVIPPVAPPQRQVRMSCILGVTHVPLIIRCVFVLRTTLNRFWASWFWAWIERYPFGNYDLAFSRSPPATCLYNRHGILVGVMLTNCFPTTTCWNPSPVSYQTVFGFLTNEIQKRYARKLNWTKNFNVILKNSSPLLARFVTECTPH